MQMKPLEDSVTDNKIVVFGLVGMLAYWAKIPFAVQTFLTLAGIDLAMGIIISLITGTFEAKKLWIGLVKKVATLLMIAASNIAETPLKHLGLNIDPDSLVAWMFCAYEFFSLSENYMRIGRLPGFIKKGLTAIQTIFDGDGSLTAQHKAVQTGQPESGDKTWQQQR